MKTNPLDDVKPLVSNKNGMDSLGGGPTCVPLVERC